jgi:N-acetyltransferase
MRAFLEVIPRGGSKADGKDSKKRKLYDKKADEKGIKLTQPRQMFIDLGQKNFGKNRECQLCKMLYVVGDVEDENRHMKNCSKVRDGLILKSLKGLKQILVEDHSRSKPIGEIFEVRRSSVGSLPENIRIVIDTVEDELGISADDIPTRAEAIYLYTINGKTVVACLVAEEICQTSFVPLSESLTATEAVVEKKGRREAHKIDQENDPSIAANILSNADEPHRILHGEVVSEKKTTLGVRQMWVHKAHRRRGYMRALLDTARKHFLFGTVVMKSHVGYSQPTEDGLRFALGYSESDTVWGYV